MEVEIVDEPERWWFQGRHADVGRATGKIFGSVRALMDLRFREGDFVEVADAAFELHSTNFA